MICVKVRFAAAVLVQPWRGLTTFLTHLVLIQVIGETVAVNQIYPDNKMDSVFYNHIYVVNFTVLYAIHLISR